jgi:hypothetical protein
MPPLHLMTGARAAPRWACWRARARDASAWERLIALYEPLVCHWCRRAGLQEADAADVRQEVFLAVSRGLADFRRDGGAGTFRGWLRVITRNKVQIEVTVAGGEGAVQYQLCALCRDRR